MNEPPTPPVLPTPADNALREANQQLVLALLRSQHPAAPLLLPQWADGRFTERDPLTGLPGRATLRERFATAATAADRDGKRLAILFIDLDGFKQLNDDLSHHAGDDALRHAARCLNASVRASDTVSRHGGDEFVVLLGELSLPDDAGRVAETMLDSLGVPEPIGGHVVSMSASIGISIYPDDGGNLEALVDQADAAMYRAKREGAGRYAFHGTDARHAAHSPEAAPGVIYPHAAPARRERLRQAQMQEANEHLLHAALVAQEMQAAAERALGEQSAVLARVAHELRDPLTPIAVAASLMEHAEASELPELRALIERQVQHVARLVDDLLDLSRARGGKLRLKRAIVDVGEVLRRVVALCRPATDARGQRVVLEIPANRLLVDGDRLRLVQVLTNLVDNASKYTPVEGVITVSAYAADADVIVAVADTGIGIGGEALASVFDPFFQEARATRFDGTGLGIGLSVVRELVEAHGGHVRAFSAGEGQGSRFVLTLPRHHSASRNGRRGRRH